MKVVERNMKGTEKVRKVKRKREGKLEKGCGVHWNKEALCRPLLVKIDSLNCTMLQQSSKPY